MVAEWPAGKANNVTADTATGAIPTEKVNKIMTEDLPLKSKLLFFIDQYYNS